MIVLLKRLDATATASPQAAALRVEDLERRHLPDLAELNRERGEPSADARFEADLEAGYGGYVALRDSRPIAFYWWIDAAAPPPSSRTSIGAAIAELGLEIDLETGDVYGADLYVGERERAGNTAQLFLDRVEASLAERGYSRLWGYVQENNRLARWTYRMRGYEPMWRVVQTRTLTRRRSRTETLSKER
jgi:GNAT superfamily N-acetyltransferase